MYKCFLSLFAALATLLSGCGDAGKTDGSNLPQVNWGELKRVYFESEWVDDRYVDILLPLGYNEAETYPVIYMQDGQMLFDSKDNLE